MNLLQRIWQDQRGAVLSSELILITAILVIGMIVGLATYRNAVVQELGDTAVAVSQLNQGYLFTGYSSPPNSMFGVVSYTVTVAGSDYTDNSDFCVDPADPDPAGLEPACIVVQEPASAEGLAPSPNP